VGLGALALVGLIRTLHSSQILSGTRPLLTKAQNSFQIVGSTCNGVKRATRFHHEVSFKPSTITLKLFQQLRKIPRKLHEILKAMAVS
jgi:hypothetical protein